MMVDSVHVVLTLEKDGHKVMNPTIYAQGLYRILNMGKKVPVNSIHDGRNNAHLLYRRNGENHTLTLFGSPLTWFFGHNIAYSGDWVALTEVWVNEVVEKVFPGCRVHAGRITQLDIFAMIDCGDECSILATIAYLGTSLCTSQRAARLYKRWGRDIDAAIPDSMTFYLGNRSVHSLVRGYDKSVKVLSGRTKKGRCIVASSPALCRCIRIEVSLRVRHVANDSRYLLGRWRDLDLSALYYGYLRRLECSHPMAVSSDVPLCESEVAASVLWKRRKFVAGPNRNRSQSDLRLRVRRTQGFDMRRAYVEYTYLNGLGSYVPFSELLNPSLDCNDQIWEDLAWMRKPHR